MLIESYVSTDQHEEGDGYVAGLLCAQPSVRVTRIHGGGKSPRSSERFSDVHVTEPSVGREWRSWSSQRFSACRVQSRLQCARAPHVTEPAVQSTLQWRRVAVAPLSPLWG